MGRNERRRHRYITDIACLTALNYIVSKNSVQPIANPSNHSPESKAHLKRFALSFEVFGMQSQPINPEYALEFLFRDQNVSKSIASLNLTHSP